MNVSFGQSARNKILSSVNIESIEKEIKSNPKDFPNYLRLKKWGKQIEKSKGEVSAELFDVFKKSTEELGNNLEYRQMLVKLKTLEEKPVIFQQELKQWASFLEKMAEEALKVIQKHIPKA